MEVAEVRWLEGPGQYKWRRYNRRSPRNPTPKRSPMRKVLPTMIALGRPGRACRRRAGARRQGRREEDRHVHRLPRDPRLPGQLSRSAQGADDRGAERQVHRGCAQRLQEGRAQASHHAWHRRFALRPGHGRRRCVLRAARLARPKCPQTPGSPARKSAALLQKGACVSCHGANFSKPIDGSYPKVAGQHADYLYTALKAYQIEQQSPHRPRQRHHAGPGQAVQPWRAQGAGAVPRLACPAKLQDRALQSRTLPLL